MDDLISRKALYDAMEKREEMYAKGNCLYDTYNYHVSAEIVANAPSVTAVSLDKLCELCEETGAGVPCAICRKIMPEWCKKNNNFPLSWDEEYTCPSWKAMLIKWMEGQHET